MMQQCSPRSPTEFSTRVAARTRLKVLKNGCSSEAWYGSHTFSLYNFQFDLAYWRVQPR
jgi:hypothetical protein